MIRNLLLVALRNFKRDKWYSLLNILGLTIGITFSLFLIFYIKDELSYDRYDEKADRSMRVGADIKEPEKEVMKWAITQVPLAATLVKDYPEVEKTVRFISNGRTMYKKGDLKFYEDKVFFTDSTIFDVFSYQFIEGSPKKALTAPNSLVLTQSVAEKFFGKKNAAVGKVLQDASGESFKVTGVIKDVPTNSHLLFNVLVSASTLPSDFGDNWGSFNIYTYVLLKPNTS